MTKPGGPSQPGASAGGLVMWRLPPLFSARRRMLARPLDLVGSKAAAVVGDVEGDQPVLDGQGNGDGGGVGVAGAVGQGLAGDGQDVVGERLVDAGAGLACEAGAAVKPSCGACSSTISKTRACRPIGAWTGLLEAEDAGADLLDDLIEGST